ncbi:ArsR/SmtB family transcription factor [Rhizobium sp. LjRoot254]|uniref:ArsR/SmtB family transcription factor n=1 Tax=Rhizobium sp. LjRoot254 TaxID=3342297 RepID=UPI003ECD6E1D
MVDEMIHSSDDDRLDGVFHALANRTRRALMRRLSEKPARVNELAAHYDMSVNAISKHLMVLEDAGLIERRREGHTQTLVLAPAALRSAEAWIGDYRGFWSDKLDRFADFMEGGGN